MIFDPIDKNKYNLILVMKSVSRYLHHFLQQNSTFEKSEFTFTPLSRTFLSSILYKINKAYLLCKNTHFIIENKWENHHYSDYEYIPQEIRKNWIEKIAKENIIQRKCTLHISGKKFHVYIWFPKFHSNSNPPIIMNDVQIEEKVNNTIRKIYLWLSVATSFLSKNTKCSNDVNIYLYLTYHSKFLPNNSRKKIDQLCANTAFTTGCISEQTNIHIYREEEWFKVFIHETFHNLGLDFIDLNTEQANKEILNLFPVSVTDLRIYETYSELWAEIMNSLFIVFLSDPPKKKGRLPLVKWISMIERIIETEMDFTMFQVKKILNHSKLKYTDLFIPEKAVTYKEDTQIFAYYILKSIWMIHLNLFLEFCAKQPGGSSLKFGLTLRNLENFIEKMKKLAKSKLVLEKYAQNNISNKDSVFANTTLRMTLYELD